MLKAYLTIALVVLSLSVFAQTQVDSILVKRVFKLNGKKVTGISNDTTLAAKDSNALITDYAAKKLIKPETDPVWLLDKPNYPTTASIQATYPPFNGTGAYGTWPISISGNAATVSNGVYTNGSYSNPSWLNSLAYSKITGAPTSLSQFSNDVGYITGSYTGFDTRYQPLGTTNLSSGVSGVLGVSNGGTGQNTLAGVQSWLGLGTAAYRNANQDLNTNSNVYFNTMNVIGGGSSNNGSSVFWTDIGDGWLKKSTVSDVRSILGLGSNAYTSTAYLPLSGANMTGRTIFNSSNTLGLVQSSTSQLYVQSANGSNAAYMTFIRYGSYAVNFGLDENSNLSVGGYSMNGNIYPILHNGNFRDYVFYNNDLPPNDINNYNYGIFKYHPVFGSANVPDGSFGLIHTEQVQGWKFQTGYSANGNVYTRYQIDGGAFSGWNTLLSSGNYTSYADTRYLQLTGGLLSGPVTAPAFYNSSDFRLKNIIKRNGDMVTYRWKDGRDKLLHYGYIAQEVQKKMPNQIMKDNNGYLSVNYTEIHTKKINDLENEVAELKREIVELKKLIKE